MNMGHKWSTLKHLCFANRNAHFCGADFDCIKRIRKVWTTCKSFQWVKHLYLDEQSRIKCLAITVKRWFCCHCMSARSLVCIRRCSFKLFTPMLKVSYASWHFADFSKSGSADRVLNAEYWWALIQRDSVKTANSHIFFAYSITKLFATAVSPAQAKLELFLAVLSFDHRALSSRALPTTELCRSALQNPKLTLFSTNCSLRMQYFTGRETGKAVLCVNRPFHSDSGISEESSEMTISSIYRMYECHLWCKK